MLTKIQKEVNLLAWVGVERASLPLRQEGRKAEIDLCGDWVGNQGGSGLCVSDMDRQADKAPKSE